MAGDFTNELSSGKRDYVYLLTDCSWQHDPVCAPVHAGILWPQEGTILTLICFGNDIMGIPHLFTASDFCHYFKVSFNSLITILSLCALSQELSSRSTGISFTLLLPKEWCTIPCFPSNFRISSEQVKTTQPKLHTLLSTVTHSLKDISKSIIHLTIFLLF